MASNCLSNLRSTQLLYTNNSSWQLGCYHPSVLELATNVQFVKGIGPRLAQTLLEKGITTVEDLLYLSLIHI